MTKKTIQVELENGFEARPVAVLVQQASTTAQFIFSVTGKRSMQKALWE